MKNEECLNANVERRMSNFEGKAGSRKAGKGLPQKPQTNESPLDDTR